MTLHFFKQADQAIVRRDDRLKLYKDLQHTQNPEGEAVMHVSSVVNDLIKISGSMPE